MMLAMVITFPNLVTDRIDKAPKVSLENIKLEAETGDYGGREEDTSKMSLPQPSEDRSTPQAGSASQEEDPMEAVKRAIEQDTNKK
jgi:hypothetical protein